MDLTTRRFLDALAAQPGPRLHELSPIEARAALRAASAGDFALPPVELKDVLIPLESGANVSVTLVRPAGRKGPLPAVLYFHGGGWVLGDYEVFRRCVVELAHGADATVAFVNYSLAPEARYPLPIEQCYAATRWVADNGHGIDVDPSRLAIVGESAGGAIAAAVVGLARLRGEPKISVQVLHCPVTDLSARSDSQREFADGYFATEQMMQWCRGHYQPNVTDPLASPLLASPEQLRGQPPGFIVTAEYDPYRDEGEAYGRKLMDAGVMVTATRYVGTIHAFMSLNPLKDTPMARAAAVQTHSVLRAAFARP
jgi:acetyl esterase/lipase